jgi:hypothetical protein
MDKRLHLLETFTATGNDGGTYKVCAYEHLVHDDSVPGAIERWEPTGTSEYRLADGARLEALGGGSLRIVGSGVELARG